MAYFELASIARSQGELKLFEQHREKVLQNLERLPERQKLRVQAAELHAETKWEEAAELLENLIAKYPDEEDAYLGLHRAYQRLNQSDKALATLEQATQALPQSGPIRNVYGYHLLRLGRYPEAIRQLETYAELNPDEPNPYDSLAEAYLITGNSEKALEKFARALEIDSSFGASHAGRA